MKEYYMIEKLNKRNILGWKTKKHSTTEKRTFRTDLYKFKMDTIRKRYNGGKNFIIKILILRIFISRILLMIDLIQDNFHQLVDKKIL
jgi:hypothetical protein